MLRNYFKIAWRNTFKNGVFTALNLFGLSMGIAIFLYLFLYTKQELSFDKHNSNYDRIVRIGQEVSFDGQTEDWACVPNIVGPTMTKELPEIETYARLLHHSFGKTAFVNSKNDKFSEQKLYWTDAGFFDIFDVDLVFGNAKTALDDPNNVLLSESIAHKYFGSNDPTGQTLKIDNEFDVLVSGVYKDFPKTSTIDANILGSFATIQWASKSLHWSNASYETYFLLGQNTSLISLTKNVNSILEKNIPEPERWFTFWVQPLSEVHLYSTNITNASTTRIGDIKQINILIALAIAILIIACINYMNLATAQSQKSKKEVGISKVMGASQGSLIKRFYVQAFIMVSLAMISGLILFMVGLPLFNYVAENSMTFSEALSSEILTAIVGITIVLTILAGSYPALMISSFSPLSLFGRKDKSYAAGEFARKGLVVLQFSASIVLIICTLVFYVQLRFMQEKDLGYNAKQVISISTEGAESKDQIDGLINEIKALSFVKSTARVQALPGGNLSTRTMSKPEDREVYASISTNFSGPEVLETLDIKLLAGNSLPSNKAIEDTMVQVVLNESAIKFYGYTPEEAIGKTAYNLFGWNNATIVGVMRDFHHADFHKPIGAYAFHNNKSEGRPNLLIRCEGGKTADNLQSIEKTFSQQMPNSAFEYMFLNDFTAKLYASETRMSRIILFFSLAAILIASLGLFGLAAYTAEKRTKEIGVRKILGASVTSIFGMLSQNFLTLVLISFAIGAPLAWYYLNSWLDGFAFRVSMPWWAFALAGLVTVLVSLLTVSYQALKAAVLDPVRSLRSE
ncbi:putative ABC transport system permease protein [Spirosomataceae bacterium TFI 002]|nr:putative ABC transport system permease protein [Spirosomataceae bacterium TFI 002]